MLPQGGWGWVVGGVLANLEGLADLELILGVQLLTLVDKRFWVFPVAREGRHSETGIARGRSA